MKDTLGIILAGGRGKRLYPITETMPKPICPVAGVPAAVRTVKAMQAAGIRRAVLTAGYRSEALEGITVPGMTVSAVCEEKPLGSAGGAKNAFTDAENALIVSGDAVFDFGLDEVLRRHGESGAEFSVVLVKAEDPTDFGCVSAENGFITRFYEKPAWDRAVSDLVNTGIYVASERIFSYIPEGAFFDFAADLFPLLVSEGIRIGGIEMEGRWFDIGTLAGYHAANMYFTGGKSSVGHSKVSEPPVRSVIMDVCRIEGRVSDSIICRNVNIGKGALIETGCCIGEGSVIGAGARLSGAVLPPGSRIGKDERIMGYCFGGRREKLFDDFGISGKYGEGVSLSTAFRAGKALGAVSGGTAAVLDSGGAYAAAVADALSCGIRSTGGAVLRGKSGFAAESRYYAADTGLLTVFVSGGENVCVSVYTVGGLPLTGRAEREAEKAFAFPPDEPKMPGAETLIPEGATAAERYAGFLRRCAGYLRGTSLRIRGIGRAADALKAAAEAAGVTADGENAAEAIISDDGESAELITPAGRRLNFWQLTALAAEGEPYCVLPRACPQRLTEYLIRRGTGILLWDSTESVARDRAGECIYPHDGAAAVLRVMKRAADRKQTTDELAAGIPDMFVRTATVARGDGKARVIAELAGKESGDGGIRLRYPSGCVTVTPIRSGFRLLAEASSFEAAEEISALAEKRLTEK